MSLESGASGPKDSFEGLHPPDTIVVTSASEIKIRTVENALRRFFPERRFNVVGVKATSGINEQPVGEEAERGAKNRIASARSLVPDELASKEKAFVSIESGIFPTTLGGWEDKAVVIVEFPNGTYITGISPQGVEFPKEAVDATRQKEGGFQKNTVGSVLAEIYAKQGIKIDKQDPQTFLSGGTLTREEQMISAIREAFLRAVGK